MKKKVIILISCLSFMTLISGCSGNEDNKEAVMEQELEEDKGLEEDKDSVEEVDDSLKEDEDDDLEELEEFEDSEDILTDPIEIVVPNSDDTPLIEINNYCKSIAHNLKNYHFEYIEELFITDMVLEVWEEELSKLGEFEQALGVQTTMLTSFLLEDESTQGDDDKETYEVIVRESYLKDGAEQELIMKIILTEKLFVSQIEVQVK